MPRLVRSDSGPWAGGLGVTSQCRTEPSQATRVESFHNGAGARIKNGKNVSADHQFQHAFTNVSRRLPMLLRIRPKKGQASFQAPKGRSDTSNLRIVLSNLRVDAEAGVLAIVAGKGEPVRVAVAFARISA